MILAFASERGENPGYDIHTHYTRCLSVKAGEERARPNLKARADAIEIGMRTRTQNVVFEKGKGAGGVICIRTQCGGFPQKAGAYALATKEIQTSERAAAMRVGF